jgi:hypothetical protein
MDRHEFIRIVAGLMHGPMWLAAVGSGIVVWLVVVVAVLEWWHDAQ